MSDSCIRVVRPHHPTLYQSQPQPQQQGRHRAKQSQVEDGNQLPVFDLRFPDDFSEYVARSEGGGSTYGLLRRHAFAQTSLRIRRPTTDDERPAVSRQRRSRSLVPPRRPSRDQIGSTDNTAVTTPNHKTLLRALCAQTQQQQQQQTKHTDTLQVT